MTMHAEKMHKVCLKHHGCISLTDTQIKIVNTFIYKIGLDEKDLTKHKKINNLTLSSVEWGQVKLFNNLLAVYH
jgi:uncharacterized HAD superfamily protein